MSLVSLKRYLNGTEDEHGYRKVISLLLSGIAENAVCTTPPDMETFRAEMQSIRATAEPDCNLNQLFVVAGAAIQALGSYNTRTTRLIGRQGTEMQNMIAMMAQAIISISGGTERAADALSDIKRELEQAAAIGDVEKLKLRLGACLEKVCDASERQKIESAAVLMELQRTVQRAITCAATDPELDSVTGLPKELAAKLAFSEALKAPGRKYILTMVIDRFQPIKARFGDTVGDEALRVWQKHVEANVIAPGDKLFRWTGPTLVALMARQGSIDQVRSGLKRVLDLRIENEFDVGGRSALIPLSVAWSIIAAIPPAANLPSFIDKFVATQVPKDYC